MFVDNHDEVKEHSAVKNMEEDSLLTLLDRASPIHKSKIYVKWLNYMYNLSKFKIVDQAYFIDCQELSFNLQ